MRHIFHFFLFLACSLCFAACSGDVVFHEYKHLEGCQWNRLDTLEYLLPESIAKGNYECSVFLRLNQSYPFSELWIAVDTELANPSQHIRDTIRVDFKEEGMNIFANGVSLSQINCPTSKIELKDGQTGKIRIFHLMSRETLPCIHDVGVMLKY